MTKDELRDARIKEFKLSQVEMAAAIGIKRRAYQYWESGEIAMPAWVGEMIRLKRMERQQNKEPEF